MNLLTEGWGKGRFCGKSVIVYLKIEFKSVYVASLHPATLFEGLANLISSLCIHVQMVFKFSGCRLKEKNKFKDSARFENTENTD